MFRSPLTRMVLVAAPLWLLPVNGESSCDEARELVGETVPVEPALESLGDRF